MNTEQASGGAGGVPWNERMTFANLTLTVREWARHRRIPASTVRYRVVVLRWPLLRAATERPGRWRGRARLDRQGRPRGHMRERLREVAWEAARKAITAEDISNAFAFELSRRLPRWLGSRHRRCDPSRMTVTLSSDPQDLFLTAKIPPIATPLRVRINRRWIEAARRAATLGYAGSGASGAACVGAGL